MSLLKKYFSYILPIKLESGIAQDKVPLHVYYDNGKIKLFTNNTNYSGGKLKLTFKKALKDIDVKNEDEVLILGFGLGSVWEVIKKDKGKDPLIIGIDYEPLIFQFIRTYFPYILSDKKTNVLITDAKEYLLNCKQRFNLIVIDLFCDDIVPEIVFSDEFVDNLSTVSHTDSIIVLNTMNVSENELFLYFKYFDLLGVKHIEGTNTIYYFRLTK